MSKEVKLGLAIGGILLSVMLVYVLVVSGDPAAPRGVSLELPSTPPSEETSPTPEPPAGLTDAAPTPPADPVAPEAAPEAPPVDEPPLAVADRSTELANDRWIQLLNEGWTETVTPEPAANPARELGPSIGGAVALPSSEPPAPERVEPGSTTVAPPLSTTPRKHTIQRGETYSSISAAAYGSASYFAHIIRANPGIDPAKLRPGMVINLPPESQVRVTAQTTRTETQDRLIDERTEYRVQGNDSLYKISMKLYGKPDRIDALYDANKALIGPDKAKLKVGAILKLPEAPTVASTQ